MHPARHRRAAAPLRRARSPAPTSWSIGRGTTVGRPLGLLLTRRSENATVTLCHTGTRDLAAHTRAADIVVAAAGVPGLLTADMVRPGAAVVDVGITRVIGEDGKGRLHRRRGARRSPRWPAALAPMPGGVGPMTRAMLLTNVVERAEGSSAPDGVARVAVRTDCTSESPTTTWVRRSPSSAPVSTARRPHSAWPSTTSSTPSCSPTSSRASPRASRWTSTSPGPIEGFETKVVGATTGPNGEGYEAIEGSDVVVITAGLPRKPGMSRMDLLEVNAKIVRQVAENVAKYAPNAVVIVVSNPLDEMTALAQLATQFPKQPGDRPGRHARHRPVHQLRRRGARACRSASVRRSPSARTATPWCRCRRSARSTASRWPTLLPADKIEELVARTRNGGAEVVALLKTGSAYYAPSAAAARMAKAVAEDSGEVMPVCAWVDGEYGISGVYLGVEAEIGADGRQAGRRDRR